MVRVVCGAFLASLCLSVAAADSFLAITSSACPPCAALHRDYGNDSRIAWVDATPEVRAKHAVRVVPTVIALRAGQEVGRHVGYHGRRDMDRWLQAMGEAPRRRF